MVMLRTDKLTGVSLGQALPSAPELRPTGGNALRTRTTSSAPPSRSWLGERAGRQPTQGIRTRHRVYRRPQVRHRVGLLVSHRLALTVTGIWTCQGVWPPPGGTYSPLSHTSPA